MADPWQADGGRSIPVQCGSALDRRGRRRTFRRGQLLYAQAHQPVGDASAFEYSRAGYRAGLAHAGLGEPPAGPCRRRRRPLLPFVLDPVAPAWADRGDHPRGHPRAVSEMYPRVARMFNARLYGWSARHATRGITHTKAARQAIAP